MNQELIDKLTALDIPTSVAQDQNEDPYTLLEKINYVIKLIMDAEKTEGTQVKVAGIFQKLIDFIDDPQAQLDALHDEDNRLKESIGRNVDGIARLGTDKQDKLSQIDLDNIAKINDLPSKAEVNSISNTPSETVDKNIFSFTGDQLISYFTAPSNGIIYVGASNNKQGTINNLNTGMATGLTPTQVGYSVGTIMISKGQKAQLSFANSVPSSIDSKFIHTKEI